MNDVQMMFHCEHLNDSTAVPSLQGMMAKLSDPAALWPRLSFNESGEFSLSRSLQKDQLQESSIMSKTFPQLSFSLMAAQLSGLLILLPTFLVFKVHLHSSRTRVLKLMGSVFQLTSDTIEL